MKYRVWTCKIVVPVYDELPDSSDGPPRQAAIRAVERLGVRVLDCFSGWGGRLTAAQKRIVTRRHSRPEDSDE